MFYYFRCREVGRSVSKANNPPAPPPGIPEFEAHLKARLLGSLPASAVVGFGFLHAAEMVGWKHASGLIPPIGTLSGWGLDGLGEWFNPAYPQLDIFRGWSF